MNKKQLIAALRARLEVAEEACVALFNEKVELEKLTQYQVSLLAEIGAKNASLTASSVKAILEQVRKNIAVLDRAEAAEAEVFRLNHEVKMLRKQLEGAQA